MSLGVTTVLLYVFLLKNGATLDTGYYNGEKSSWHLLNQHFIYNLVEKKQTSVLGKAQDFVYVEVTCSDVARNKIFVTPPPRKLGTFSNYGGNTSVMM